MHTAQQIKLSTSLSRPLSTPVSELNYDKDDFLRRNVQFQDRYQLEEGSGHTARHTDFFETHSFSCRCRTCAPLVDSKYIQCVSGLFCSTTRKRPCQMWSFHRQLWTLTHPPLHNLPAEYSFYLLVHATSHFVHALLISVFYAQ